MEQVTFIQRMPFAEALAAGKVVYCQEEVDAAFIKAVLAQSLPGPRELKILYSPLHGVGASAVYPVLDEAGFRDVEIFGPHAAPDGDFPNVPKHVANPENPAVFDAMIERAKQTGAELILATDPDCDRLGCAGAEVARPRTPLGHAHRQPTRLAAGRFPAGRPAGGRHAHAANITSSRRW